MKNILLLLFSVSTLISYGQLTNAGGQPTSGGVSEFYFDEKDDLLYAIGDVWSASGNSVNGIVAWNGNEWIAKGDESLLRGSGTQWYRGMSIARNNDTLFVMGDVTTHTIGPPLILLMYWDETAKNWKEKSYGITGNTRGLVSNLDTLYIFGDLQLGLDTSEVYFTDTVSLGSLAYWNGGKWVRVPNTPTDFYGMNANQHRIVSHEGALYVGNYKYKNKQWSKLLEDSITSVEVWENKIVYATGKNDSSYIKTYDGTKWETIGAFNAQVYDITTVGENLAITGFWKRTSQDSIKGAGFYDGTKWWSYNNFLYADKIGGYHNQVLIGLFSDLDILRIDPLPEKYLGSIAVQDVVITVSMQSDGVGTNANVFPNPTSGTLHFDKPYDEVQV